MALKDFKGCHTKGIDIGWWRCMFMAPLFGCSIGISEEVFTRIWGGSGFRVACNPEICQAPMALVEQNVLGFEVTMHDILLKASKGFSHINKDVQGLVCGKLPSSSIEMLAKRFLRAWHYENKVVLPFARVHDGNNVRFTR